MTMPPPQPEDRSDLLTTLSYALAFAFVLFMAMSVRERNELQDQLRNERDRRQELQDQAREREGKLDGALDTIKRLTDERDTDR